MGLDSAISLFLGLVMLIGIVFLIEGPLFLLFLCMADGWGTLGEAGEDLCDAVDRFWDSMADALEPLTTPLFAGIERIGERVRHIGKA